MNVKQLITLIDVLRHGSEFANAVKAKKWAAAFGLASVLIYGAGAAAKEFGYVDGPEIAKHLGMLLGSLAGLFVTFGTSSDVGILPPKREADPGPAPDQYLPPGD